MRRVRSAGASSFCVFLNDSEIGLNVTTPTTVHLSMSMSDYVTRQKCVLSNMNEMSCIWVINSLDNG